MGFLRDLASAVALAARETAADMAEEKRRTILLSGDYECTVYTYYGSRLKGLRVGQKFDALVVPGPVTLVSELTGTVWDTGERGDNALSYNGRPFGSFGAMEKTIRKLIDKGYKIKVRCVHTGWYAEGIPAIVATIPQPREVFDWIDECERLGEEVPFRGGR